MVTKYLFLLKKKSSGSFIVFFQTYTKAHTQWLSRVEGFINTFFSKIEWTNSYESISDNKCYYLGLH